MSQDTAYITIVGDICLAGEDKALASSGARSLWAGLETAVGRMDLVIGNVENALSERGTPRPLKYACLRASPTSAAKLDGLRVAVLANNHVGDFGAEAASDTVTTLTDRGIAVCGYGDNLERAIQPCIVHVAGRRLAVLAFCCPTTNSEFLATHQAPGVAPLSTRLLRESLAHARRMADIVMVYLHWGVEESHRPVADQVRIGRLAVDWGADAVVGCHAHVIQTYECYKGRWIFHGLGNFVFGAVQCQDTRPGGGIAESRREQCARNKESLAVRFQVTNNETEPRLKLDRIVPMRCGQDYVPEPASWESLTVDVEAMNRELSRALLYRRERLWDDGEAFFRSVFRNGILAYSYDSQPIQAVTGRDVAKRLARSVMSRMRSAGRRMKGR